jgi:hypothetical protein
MTIQFTFDGPEHFAEVVKRTHEHVIPIIVDLDKEEGPEEMLRVTTALFALLAQRLITMHGIPRESGIDQLVTIINTIYDGDLGSLAQDN